VSTTAGPRPQGRHAGLDAATIIEEAIRLADLDGLGALSMRRLGASLGVEAMALYHYFPSKAALLDAVVEHLASSAPLQDVGGPDWRSGLRSYAVAQLAALGEHPHLLELVRTRPAITPGNLEMLETLVAHLHRAGFSPATALDMVYVINELVLSHATPGAADPAQGASTREESQRRRLADAVTGEHPRLAEAVQEARDGAGTRRFEFALDALLAGFAAMQER
jgi:AcrR family transcriptional regulator